MVSPYHFAVPAKFYAAATKTVACHVGTPARLSDGSPAVPGRASLRRASNPRLGFCRTIELMSRLGVNELMRCPLLFPSIFFPRGTFGVQFSKMGTGTRMVGTAEEAIPSGASVA